MKKFLAIASLALITGCIGEPDLDASSKESIKTSIKEMREDLPAEKQEAFESAILYFSLNGTGAPKSLMEMATLAKAKSDSFLVDNLSPLDGMSANEIMEKHTAIIASAQESRELQEKAAALMEEKRFDEAMEVYKQLGSTENGKVASAEGLKTAQEAKEGFTEKMEYIDKVEITEFTADRIDTYLDKGVPAVRLSLKNTGDRSLDQVKVVVYFQNSEGNTIFEEDFHPVNVNSYMGNSKPLKAGYVFEMEKGKYFTIESALSEWAEGKAVAKVTDIEFSE